MSWSCRYLEVVEPGQGSREDPGAGVVSVTDVGHCSLEDQSAVGDGVDGVVVAVRVERHTLLQRNCR